jgi:hypothetical protein
MHTGAVRELVAAAEEAAEWIHERTTHSKIEYLLRASVEAVKAEEKPQTHEFFSGSSNGFRVFCQHEETTRCGLPHDAPSHQTGGK